MGLLDLPAGYQLARARWGTHVSGEAFDRKKSSFLTEQARTFIARQSFCVIAGEDAQQELSALVAPGLPGFVQTLDEQTCLLALPGSLNATRLMQSLLQPRESGHHTRLGLFFLSHPTRERLCVHGSVTCVAGPSPDPSYGYGTQDEGAISIRVHVHQAFFHCAKYIKTRIPGLTCPAEAREERTWQIQHLLNHPHSYLTEEMLAFLAEHALCYLCTIDRHGQPAVNHRGGAPGFLVGTLPDRFHAGGMLLLPDYAGNGAFEAIGNLFETGKAVLIVPDYAAQLAVCLTGSALVLERDELPGEIAQQYVGAERVIALSVQRVEIQGGDWSTALATERSFAETIEVLDESILSCSL